jgi:acyl-CoA synthetase (AMP-forming)/AMP-acid ligase II
VRRFRTLIDALNTAPAERPFVTYWADEDEQETVTFGQFRQRAGAHGQWLRTHDIGRGDRVVLIMPQGIPLMTMFAGAMMLGAVPAILAYPNFKFEPEKYRSGLAGVTANLGAKAVVIDEAFPDDLLGHVAVVDKLLRASGAEKVEALPLPEFANGENDLAPIQHSAGTTGLQKGVALTHRAVLTQIEHLAERLGIDEGKDRVYSWLPLYHDMGLIACFMLPLVCHIPVVLQSPLDWVMQPESMLQAMSEHQCTLAWLPNFAFQFTARRVRAERRRDCDLSSVRALINCSEPVRASSMDEFERAFRDCGLRAGALQSSYAMAENVFAVTQSDLTHTGGPVRVWVDGVRFRTEHVAVPVSEQTNGAVCFVSSGRVLPKNEVRIVSEDTAELSDGRVGEILVKSDCLFDGYFNRKDLTADVLSDGWYRTGDLGFLWRAELFVIGRKKDLLIVGGENLYPQDIEEIVAGHPDIHDGRVVAGGLYNADSGTEDIVVVAEVDAEDALTRAPEIEQDIRRRVVAGLGVSVRSISLKPPKWIVKSTAGKPARSATLEKLVREHPELGSRV